MFECTLCSIVCLWMNSNSSLLRVNEHGDGPLCSFCQSFTLIKYHINKSHSRSMQQFDSGREGKVLEKWGKKTVVVSWCKEEETGTATVLWLRMFLPLPSKQSADSILGAHYSILWAGGDATGQRWDLDPRGGAEERGEENLQLQVCCLSSSF